MAAALTLRTDLGIQLAKVRGGSPSTTKAYRGAVRDFVVWCSEHQLSPNVDSAGEYIGAVRRQKRSAAYTNQRIAALRLAFRQAAQRQGATFRELAVLSLALNAWKPVKVGRPEIRTITPDERAKLFSALPERVALIARLIYSTGARVSEIVGLTHQDVIADGPAVRVLLHGKGERTRHVRIPLPLYTSIVKAFGPGDEGAPLFVTNAGQPFTRQYVNRELGRASLRVLGRRVGPHQLRHSRASDLYAATRKLVGISAMLGHQSIDTTSRFYVRDSLTDAELFGDGQ